MLDDVDTTPDTAAELVRYLCSLPPDVDDGDVVWALNRCERAARHAESTRRALTDLPIDAHAFASLFGVERRAQISTLARLRASLEVDGSVRPAASGFLGLLLATLYGLEISEIRLRRGVEGDLLPQERQIVDVGGDALRRLFCDADVRAQVVDIYFPRKNDWWDGFLDLDSCEYWRAGTTSCIVKVRRVANGLDATDTKEYVLKLVWLPFLSITEIARSTEEYAARYKLPKGSRDDGPIVPVHGSGAGWVVMDFVDGMTLDEYLSEGRKPTASRKPETWVSRLADRALGTDDGDVELPDDIDVPAMEVVARSLCRALAENQRVSTAAGSARPHFHGDLTPANVILRHNKIDDLVLIDFGANHLFTRAASAGDQARAGFVAPEVRNGAPSPKSDVFSLAQTLIDFARQRVDGRGVVPDRFYEAYPGLAALLEDLLDADPARRWGGRKAVDYVELQTLLQFEFDVATRMGEVGARQASALGDVLWELRAPLNAEPRRQLRTYSTIVRWPGTRHLDRFLAAEPPRPGDGKPKSEWLEPVVDAEAVGRIVRQHVEERRRTVLYLRGWSVVGAVAASLALLLSFWWLLRVLPLERLPEGGRLLREIVDAPAYLYDLLDWINRTPVGSRPMRNEIAIRLAAFSYALLHAKLYQAVYARVLPRAVPGSRGSAPAARAAEVWMRTLPFLGAVLVLWVTLYDVDDWIWAIVVGQTATFVGNFAVHRYVSSALRAGSKHLNTVPDLWEQVTGFDSVRSWVRGSLFEAVVCWGVGLLLAGGALQDVWLYASMIAALNIFLLYVVKCGLDAPLIRVALHRATFSADRLGTRTSSPGMQEPGSAAHALSEVRIVDWKSS